MKRLSLLFTLLALGGITLQAQTSTAVSGSCADSINGLVKIVYDASLNCPGEPGTFEGFPAAGFHSGANNFANTVTWDDPGAGTLNNADCDIFELLINVEAYYGISYDSLSNIQFVANQGATDPLDPWSLVGRDTVPGGFGCADLLVDLADIPQCPQFCSPDTVTYPDFGLWPDTLMGFETASACDCDYAQAITINVRDDTLIDVPGVGPLLFEIIHFRLDSIDGLPPGFFVECEADNYRKPDASNPVSCVVDQLTFNCATLKGNPQVAGAGSYSSVWWVTGKLYHPATDTIESVSNFDYTIEVEECGDCSSDDPPTGLSSSFDPGTGLTLSWDPVPGSVACQVRAGLVGGGKTSRLVYGDEPSSIFVPLGFLNPGFSYEWNVRCACETSPLDATPYAEPDTVTLPVFRPHVHSVLIDMHPNPATESLRLTLMSEQSGDQDILIVDLLGRVVLRERVDLHKGHNNLDIDLTPLAEGSYLLQSANGSFESRALQIIR